MGSDGAEVVAGFHRVSAGGGTLRGGDVFEGVADRARRQIPVAVATLLTHPAVAVDDDGRVGSDNIALVENRDDSCRCGRVRA